MLPAKNLRETRAKFGGANIFFTYSKVFTKNYKQQTLILGIHEELHRDLWDGALSRRGSILPEAVDLETKRFGCRDFQYF